MFKKILTFLTLFLAFAFFVPQVFASTFYLSPGSANIPSGSVVYVTVGINTAGESINGVSAYLSYASDKLEVASISYGGAFGIAAEGSYGGGGIRISRGSISGFSGNGTIARIGFRGKAQGTASVSFIGGSAAVRTSDSSDSLNLGGSAGGVYTVGPAAKGALPSTGSSTPKATTAPLPEDKEKPTITNVLVSSLSSNSAVITWQTNEKSDSTVDYGLAKDRYILDLYDKNLLMDHSVKLEGLALTPGAVMHFRVKSKDAAENEAVGTDDTFHLKGYNIKIKVLDKKNMPVPNTQIFLYSDPVKAVTDVNGEAYFIDLTAGKHLAVVKLKNGFDKTLEIDVQEMNSLQTFTLLADPSLKPVVNTTLYILVAIAVLGIGSFILIKKKKINILAIFTKTKPNTEENSSPNPPTL